MKPKRPVSEWPDDPASEPLRCEGTKAHPGCGKPFRAVARHEDGKRCGRDRCPHCGAKRAVPASLHATYEKWFGLVKQYAQNAARAGWDFDAAFDAAHDAYVKALLRWLPDMAAFSTFAMSTMRHAVRAAPPRPVNATDTEANPMRSGALVETGCENVSILNRVPAPEGDPEVGRSAEIAAALKKLPRRDARILTLRFGLCDGKSRTLSEVAKRVGLSKQRVHQIEVRAFAALRGILNPSTGV